MRTFGLIPAAGLSRRMGRPKLLLPVGEKTVVEHVVSALREAGIDGVLVVVAPGAGALAGRAAAAGAQAMQLTHDTPDMRATCLHGLAWMEQHWQVRDDDGWLLLPADHPTVRGDVIYAILDAAHQHRDKSIVVPAYFGRRGHPTWLSWSHVATLRAFAPDLGMNAFIRQRADETLELPWPTDDILRDLDTPEDYERLLNSSRSQASG